MKKIIIMFIIFGLPVHAWAETIKVNVPGMVCQLCVIGIKKQFKKNVRHLDDVQVDLDTKIVTITTDKKLSDEVIKEKIKDSGYEVKSIERVPDATTSKEKSKISKSISNEKKE